MTLLKYPHLILSIKISRNVGTRKKTLCALECEYLILKFNKTNLVVVPQGDLMAKNKTENALTGAAMNSWQIEDDFLKNCPKISGKSDLRFSQYLARGVTRIFANI